MGSTPSSGPGSLFLLIPQQAEFLFNTHIQFLINWLASNRERFLGFTVNNGLESPHLPTQQAMAILEIVREAHSLLAAFLDFFSAPNRAIACMYSFI